MYVCDVSVRIEARVFGLSGKCMNFGCVYSHIFNCELFPATLAHTYVLYAHTRMYVCYGEFSDNECMPFMPTRHTGTYIQMFDCMNHKLR